ncbi:MAG: bifunctional folylpolyglutamate synthase/dihydrofolate synthase [Deltaproteobacteria bacterium]|uniref:bifunctional folylpolyglutamate synthase/dihydrofolate synthase n=1 Tax=Desulfobacula sp. TaxID=2593537 RepID=UPI0019827F86|nr:bifunctional folylpolyglutamate synthase/dihydrofolate synthase [Candidatus Desulfobacula maris]MBL6993544.1 bifunctional folylpolyglutamate synthase/dihydrofolate synthase [Desulfobacula sp.]
MKKNAYQKCLDKIYKLGRFGIKLELDTILNILKILNNPQKNYRLVHVAGTNGKGSTATYIASILQKAGFKTGLYTSPHLVKFNERISINGKQISNDQIVAVYEAVHAADIGKRKATFFEIATAMGFYHFSKENVDWAVIETGMGGRFDATNVINPQVSVITNLSIEHTEYLGNTIKDLAKEKGGIIKQSTPVVIGISQPSGLVVIKQLAKEKSSDLFIYKKDFSTRKNPNQNTYTYTGLNKNFHRLIKPLPGDHQKENLSLALAACELIFEKLKMTDKKYNFNETLVQEGLLLAKWPGRLEYVRQNPLVIIDGAHNLMAARMLGKYLSSTLKNRRLTLVIGILDDKPYEKMLKSLVPCAQHIIITKAKINRSLDPSVLKEAAQRFTTCPVTIIEDVKEAVTHAIETSNAEDAICIAGSLYVAGEAREKFENDLEH